MSITEELLQKIRLSPAAVSVLPGGKSYSSEVVDCRQQLHLLNRGIWAERLGASGGVIIFGLDMLVVR